MINKIEGLGHVFDIIIHSDEYTPEDRYGSLNILFAVEEHFEKIDFMQIEKTRKGISFIVGHPGGSAMRMRAQGRDHFCVVYQVPMTKGTLSEQGHDTTFNFSDKEQMDELMELIQVRMFYKPKP